MEETTCLTYQLDLEQGQFIQALPDPQTGVAYIPIFSTKGRELLSDLIEAYYTFNYSEYVELHESLQPFMLDFKQAPTPTQYIRRQCVHCGWAFPSYGEENIQSQSRKILNIRKFIQYKEDENGDLIYDWIIKVSCAECGADIKFSESNHVDGYEIVDPDIFEAL